jgi:molybdopterin-synthase adenylyltransferase
MSGSHVVQQLAHQGLGTIIAVDNETLDETNLGRVVGAAHVDIDRTRKVNLAERVATAIDPDINVVKLDKRFPSPEAIVALKTADVIVSCVDTFRAREAINLLCRRYMIPWGSKNNPQGEIRGQIRATPTSRSAGGTTTCGTTTSSSY